MTGNLVEAYHGVYTSSKEIIKNKQRHLYVNMLDLLSRTIKTASSSVKDLITEDNVKFWYMDILPLVFDEDNAIQDSAISAIEIILQCIHPAKVQSLSEWNAIKSTIIEVYSKKLHEMRQVSNSNWHKIWSLLVRTLNKEILKGATVINTFLSIVELGFRSSNYKTRAEAFICWKVLVEIFANYNEIFSPKRIKLICIPLKSSQSKTPETAVNKFKVWWYFLCKLNGKIEHYYDTTFETFLLFCFGTADKNSPQAQGRHYPIVKQMAIACLIEMLGPSTKETQCLLEATGLERPGMPLITTSLMVKCRQSILNACFEATIMIAEKSPERNKLFEILWRNLFAQILKTNEPKFYSDCCNKIKFLIDTNGYKNENSMQQYILYIMEVFGTYKGFPFDNFEYVNDVQQLCNVITAITELLSYDQIKCSKELTEAIINNIYDLEKFKSSTKYWNIQKNLIESTIINEDSINVTVKILIWKKLSECLKNYLNERLFEFRIEKNAEIVNKWIFWPLEKCDNANFIDESFLSSWKHLVMAASKAEGNCNFARAVSGQLKSLFEKEKEVRPSGLPDILSIFITTLDVSFDKSSKPVESFDLINYALSKSTVNQREANNKIITTLSSYINRLPENQIIEVFDNLKAITLTLINALNTKSFSKHTYEEFKKTLTDKLKTNKAKEKKLLKEFKDLFKADSNPFVIIPTPWSFNPDKLTEHQREKMKEKRSDIPALYNDISHNTSHSQEVIKPWTPKKIVIARGKNCEEIVIENKENNDDDIVEIVSPIPAVNAGDVVELFNDDNANLALEICDEGNVNKNKLIVDPDNSISNGAHVVDESLDIDVDTINTKNKVNDSKVQVHSDKDETEKKTKKLLTEEDEELLKKYNIQVEDQKKKLTLVRQLRSIEIDTVDGNTFVQVQEKLRSKRPGKQEEAINKAIVKQKSVKRVRQNKEDQNHEDAEDNKKRKTARKSLAFEKKNNSTCIESEETGTSVMTLKENKEEKKLTSANSSLDEVIQSSQEPSQSILAKKVAQRKLRQSPSSNNTAYSHNRSTLAFVKSPDVTGKKRETIEEKDAPNIADSSSEKLVKERLENTGSPFKSAKQTKRVLETPVKRDENAINITKGKETNTATDATAIVTPSTSSVTKSPAKIQEMKQQNVNEKIESPCKSNYNNNVEVVDIDDVLLSTTEISDGKKSPFKETKVLRSSPRKSPFKSVNKIEGPSAVSKTNATIITENQAVAGTPPLLHDKSKSVGVIQSPQVSSPSSDKETSHNNSRNSLNKSILSSPFKDTEERNAEFMNDTLNISPIVNYPENNCEIQKTEGLKNVYPESSTSKFNVVAKPCPDESEKLSSPKRQIKNSNNMQSSPPDRKLITTSESPIVRPKQISQLTGRGAQIMNMIRNKKFDVSSKTPVNALTTAKIESKTSPEKASQGQHPQQNSPDNDEATVPVGPKPTHKDLLIFSKVLPSPTASPSASILKRKFRQDSFEELDSPANKRKRVSFHDPPVSVTKEYVKHAEEDRVLKTTFNRCLMLDKTSTPQNSKHSFRRKSRADSLLEIAKFADAPEQAIVADISTESSDTITPIEQPSVEMDPLKWNGTTDDQAQNNDDDSLTPSPSLYFPDDAGVFNYIFEKYQIEDILEKYIASGKTVTNKSVRAITKEISYAMTDDVKLKTNVLELLSEKHPKEFLDHAIQENLSSVVCDRLNPASVAEFVCEKAKINTGMRKRLLEQVQNMLADNLSAENYEFLLSLLRNHYMSDEQVIDCIDVIVMRHKSKKCSVSELADDAALNASVSHS